MGAMHDAAGSELTEFVTVTIGDQLFGLPIARVQDVFVPERLTRVPLAPPEVAGILNLRGRVVTAIDMRMRLDLAGRGDGQPAMAIGIDSKSESYGLLVDSVGEVMKLPANACEPKPANLNSRIGRVASGVYRLDNKLMVVLDVDRILVMRESAMAA